MLNRDLINEAVRYLRERGVTDRFTASGKLAGFPRYVQLSIDDRAEVLDLVQPIWEADPGHGNSGPGYPPFPGPFRAGE